RPGDRGLAGPALPEAHGELVGLVVVGLQPGAPFGGRGEEDGLVWSAHGASAPLDSTTDTHGRTRTGPANCDASATFLLSVWVRVGPWFISCAFGASV